MLSVVELKTLSVFS